MIKRFWWLLPVLGAAVLITVLLLGARKQVTITRDGETFVVVTHAFTVGNALRSIGIDYRAEDEISPSPSALLKRNAEIRIDTAKPVHILVQPGDIWLHSLSSKRIANELLGDAGIQMQPGDRLFFNGLSISPDETLPLAAVYVLQLRTAQPLEINGETTIHSGAFSVMQALQENDIFLHISDDLSPADQVDINGPISLSIMPAQKVSITYLDQTSTGFSKAATVGQALVEAGISLQGLDYSIPQETDPVPADGKIHIVAVRENIKLDQTASPYGIDSVYDANTELDTTAILSPGQYGLKVSRLTTRVEDGKETGRLQEPAVEISKPVNEKIGYGTKVVIHTLQTPDGLIEYYRAVTVYVTSYSPCRSAADRCYPGTSAGVPVQRGVIASTLKWYRLFKWQQLYVPGYGVGSLVDVGGGVPGTYWIDVAYSDEDYVPWDSYVTIYFLTPVPANVPIVLP